MRLNATLRHRLAWTVIALIALCWLRPAFSFRTEITVDAGRPLGRANPLLLGNNIQWVDRGDEMLQAGDKGLSAVMLERAREMGVPLLRYPGGSLADLYHWRDGIGEMSRRGRNEHFHSGRKQAVELGTQEFLELCEALGAQPLITVNVASGSAEEAAAWVRHVNGGGLKSRLTGRPLPRVKIWEIGNEPYLKDEKQRKLWMSAEEFAQRATRFMQAMRQADSGIEFAIPLRSDSIGGRPATPLPGFNAAVLQGIGADFDYVALHNAYLPFDMEGRHGEEELYWASLAAPRVVEADLEETRRQLARFRPHRKIRLAVTEFNALFTIGRAHDAYIRTAAGALYVADLLRLFAYMPDLAFANFWSLSGNWHFGAIDRAGRPRPVFDVLRAYRELLSGSLLPVSVRTKTVDTPRAGFVPAMSEVPVVTAIASADEKIIRLLVFNRDPTQAAETAVALTPALPGGKARMRLFRGGGRFEVTEAGSGWRSSELDLEVQEQGMRLELPPLSFALIELTHGAAGGGRRGPAAPRRR